MDLSQLLLNLGLNVASNAIYDVVRSALRRDPKISRDSLKKELSVFLRIDGADIKADTIITFLAEHGDIVITGSQIYATEKIELESAPSTKFILADKSSSSTLKSSIQVGQGASIQGQGGAKIVQNPDGSISFYT